MLIARLDAGDAVAVEATVCRVAEIIAPRHPDATPDELRALAFGWLARPAELFALLLETHRAPHRRARRPRTRPRLDLDGRTPSPGPRCRVRWRSPPTSSTRCATSTSRPLAPKAVLHVHLHEAALHGTDGVARVEGFGPVTLTRLTELLARLDLKIQPVKDLSGRVRYTAYEHPESLRDQVHLITGGDYWPYATSTSRNVDLDHPTPYDHGRGERRGENPRRTRPAPTTPAPSADDTTAGRPTRATSHASAAKDATSGSPRTASASSSTTPAPTASTPRRRG